jgi:peptidoglycan/LPS O-acetylase OafA/YrhL
LEALTGVRFLAAMHVVIFHGEGLLTWTPPAVQSLIHQGYTGVSLFFVLSGFILAYNYLDPARDRPVDAAAFWSARLARIGPAYYLAFLLTLPLFLYFLVSTLPPLQASAKALFVAVPSFLLVQAWIPQTLAQLNAPGWSLAVEAFFYLLFPLVGIWLLRYQRRGLLAIIVALWILACIPPLLQLALRPEARGLTLLFSLPAWLQPPYSVWNGFFTAFPLFHLPQFLIGVAVGILFIRRPAGAPAPYLLRGVVGSTCAEAALLVLLVATWLATSAGWFSEALLNNGLLAVIFAPLLVVLAQGKGALSWLLSRPAVILLGEASYGIYIFQEPMKRWLQLAARGFGHPEWTMAMFLVYVGVLIAFSVLVLQGEERLRPLLRARLARVLRGRPSNDRGSERRYPTPPAGVPRLA